MLSEAYREYENGSQLGSFDDYRQACKKHWVTYREYAYQYEFYKKSEVERNEYVSRLRMASFYWKYTPASVKYVFREKRRFLRKFNGYIHRKWLYVPEASFEEFEQLLCSHDCIVKPCDGKLGQGISKVYKDGDHTNDRLLYETCVKDRMLLEQCIEDCDELKALHPESLNTIRVVTISNREKSMVFSGVLSTGTGNNIVDNSHAGGVSAQIDVECCRKRWCRY